MKIGLDIHGVADTNPEFWSKFTKTIVDAGGEVHIITGKRFKQVALELEQLNLTYTHFFSITDHHETNGSDVQNDENGNPHMDPYEWDKTKAYYCRENEIDIHFDDSDVYSYFFKTPYARFYSKDSLRQRKVKI